MKEGSGRKGASQCEEGEEKQEREKREGGKDEAGGLRLNMHLEKAKKGKAGPVEVSVGVGRDRFGGGGCAVAMDRRRNNRLGG